VARENRHPVAEVHLIVPSGGPECASFGPEKSAEFFFALTAT